MGKESFDLVAAVVGRIVYFGAKNIHETFESERMKELIYKNLSMIGFNLPTMNRTLLGECLSELLSSVSERKIKLFANNIFPLDHVRQAFHALASRQTVGKVVLVP